MKTVLFILTLFLSSLFSDKLTNQEAERIFNNCAKNGNLYEGTLLVTGKIPDYFFTPSDLEIYKKLEKDSLITIETSNDYFVINISDKGKEFISKKVIPVEENINAIEVKLFYYKFDKIIEIQEIPYNNTARVVVNIKKEKETPFIILKDKEFLDTFQKSFLYRKTNNGWKLCD